MQDTPQNTSSTSQTRINESVDRRTQMEDAKVLRESVTIRCTPSQAFETWREFSNLPRFMRNVARVDVLSPTRSHWVVELPHHALPETTVEWEAEIISEHFGESISWRSVESAQVRQSGTVWFAKAPADRGTVVSLSLSYELPGGKLTEFATKMLLEDPKTLSLQDLRNFKAYMETGEVPTITGQPNGHDEENEKIH